MDRRWWTGLVLGALAFGAGAFDLQGHRGARGLKPENTLAAFECAIGLGVTTLELDLHMSADGRLVVHHDPALNPQIARGGDGAWVVPPTPVLRQLSLAELRGYDVGRLRPGGALSIEFAQQQPVDGQRIPTLDEVLALLTAPGRGALRLNAEIKYDPRRPELYAEPQALVRALHEALAARGLSARTTVQSFHWDTLKLSQRLAPSVPTAYLSSPNSVRSPAFTAGLRIEEHGGVPQMVKAAGGAIWSPAWRDLTVEQVRQAQALGLKVVPWTVNETADMQRVLELGVDGLITDYPDRARALLQARGVALPPAGPGCAPSRASPGRGG